MGVCICLWWAVAAHSSLFGDWNWYLSVREKERRAFQVMWGWYWWGFVQAGRARLTFWIDSEALIDQCCTWFHTYYLHFYWSGWSSDIRKFMMWLSVGAYWGKLPLGDNGATIVNKKSEVSVPILSWSIVRFSELSIGSSDRLKVFSWTRF